MGVQRGRLDASMILDTYYEQCRSCNGEHLLEAKSAPEIGISVGEGEGSAAPARAGNQPGAPSPAPPSEPVTMRGGICKWCDAELGGES